MGVSDRACVFLGQDSSKRRERLMGGGERVDSGFGRTCVGAGALFLTRVGRG